MPVHDTGFRNISRHQYGVGHRLLTGLILGIAATAAPSFCIADKPQSAKTETRQKVEDRSSNDSSKAKGEINFDDLKFDIVKDQSFKATMLNKDVKSLEGKKVKLRGYILPATLYKEKGIEQFVLVRDNQECCFGPGAALYDCVWIDMVPGKTTDFVTRPVTVEGKFEIDTESYKYPDGAGPKGATHFAIFRIKGLSVK